MSYDSSLLNVGAAGSYACCTKLYRTQLIHLPPDLLASRRV